MMRQTRVNVQPVYNRHLTILTDCPVTGMQAQKLTQKPVVILDGQASWWHCSACQGWHIHLEQECPVFLEIS